MDRPVRVHADTRQNLILSALHLFADDGIDAVSMRTINNAAGTRNASAVHYHFGNKLGIIEAVLTFVRRELDRHRNRQLDALEERVRTGHPPSTREIMRAALYPYVLLRATPDYGDAAARFLGRMQTDTSPEIRELLIRDPNETTRRIDALLERALPHLPPAIRRTRYLYAWTLIVQGISSRIHWEHTSLGDLTPDTTEEAATRYLDFLVAGLEGPASPTGMEAGLPAPVRA